MGDEQAARPFTAWTHYPMSGSGEGEFGEQEGNLLAILGTHGEREGAVLNSYAQLVEHCEDEGTRYLGQLILDDEERHHRITEEMLNQVRSVVEDLDIEPKTPSMVGRVSDDLLAETKRLLAFEKDDLAELRRLRKDLKHAKAFPLLSLLVNLMIQDTRKHIEILTFLRSSA